MLTPVSLGEPATNSVLAFDQGGIDSNKLACVREGVSGDGESLQHLLIVQVVKDSNCHHNRAWSHGHVVHRSDRAAYEAASITKSLRAAKM